MTDRELSALIANVAGFRPGPYEVHVHPSDVDEVAGHTDVLEKWKATIVPDDDVEPGELFVSAAEAPRG